VNISFSKIMKSYFHLPIDKTIIILHDIEAQTVEAMNSLKNEGYELFYLIKSIGLILLE
jgi:hypothetical protein